MTDHITIAIDAMGGENSPDKTIEGISHHLKKSNNTFYLIFGNEKLIKPLIKKYKIDSDKYKIVHTEKNIEDTDTALGAAKKGKDTSLWLAMESLKKGDSDCVVSAGNTGALSVIAKLNLEMITNIDKPALSALWPNKNGMSVVLDLGANAECNSENLLDFAVMGSTYYKVLYPQIDTKVALLNIGSEELKGNNLIQETHELMKSDKRINYQGFVEADEITSTNNHVIVTDGFSGNIALKTAEGVSKFITDSLKKSLTSTSFSKILSLLLKKNFKDFKNLIDPRNYNGRMFIGVNGIVTKSHGNADSHSFANAIDFGVRCIDYDLLNEIKKNVSR
mgnify:CR=1 FL=1